MDSYNYYDNLDLLLEELQEINIYPEQKDLVLNDWFCKGQSIRITLEGDTYSYHVTIPDDNQRFYQSHQMTVSEQIQNVMDYAQL